MRPDRIKPSRTVIILLSALVPLAASCTPFTFQALTAPLGSGDVIASRDNVRVSVFNRTPYRAIFTIGMFNFWTQESQPQFSQFANGEDNSLVLEGNTMIGPQILICDRTVGVGTQELIRQIRKFNREENLNLPALKLGVGFSSAPVDDPLGVEPIEGTAEGINIYIGVDFPCESELLLFLEEDASAPGGFRIAFEVVTPP